MRYTLFIILVLIPFLSLAQFQDDSLNVNVIKTEYTQLDKISKDFAPLFGSSNGKIDFVLVEIKNLSTNEKLIGVEIKIERTDTEVISKSIGFANIGSFWGTNSKVTARNLSKEGYILLLKDDLKIVMDYLNQIIGATGQAQEYYKSYSLSLYDKFELGMLYDEVWYFIVSIDSATYRLNYKEGLEMLMKLNDFSQSLQADS